MLTVQERIFLVQRVFVNGGEYSRKVQEEFRQQFGDDLVPHRNCIFELIKKFKETGTVHDKIRSGRLKKLIEPALRDVTNKLERSPTKSLRRLSQETGLSSGSIHNAVHKIKFRPYKRHVVRKLKDLFLMLSVGINTTACYFLNTL